jgi:hypothetical protein
MKEFKSSNGLTMVEGKLFNWRKESIYYGKNEPYGYLIDMGNIGEMYSATYMEKDHNLCIYRNSDHMDFIANFYCDDIYVAETIVFAFIKGNSKISMVGTIYNKMK